jgi:hypothetical protein
VRYTGGFTTEFKFKFEFKLALKLLLVFEFEFEFENPPSTGPEITRIKGTGMEGLGSAGAHTGLILG